MRAFPSTDALTALRELPAAALRSAPPGLQAPLRRTLRSGQRAGTNTGNFYYAKIEPKSRKTDPFMALVASMTEEAVIGTGEPVKLPPIGAIRL